MIVESPGSSAFSHEKIAFYQLDGISDLPLKIQANIYFKLLKLFRLSWNLTWQIINLPINHWAGGYCHTTKT